MNFTQEKILYGVSNYSASVILYFAAILSPVESRWALVTLASSLAVSCSLTLTFKGMDETIRLIIGRASLAILSGIFLTKPTVWFFAITTAHTDVIALGGVSAACCAFGFILGYAGLNYLMKKSDAIAKRFIDGKIKQYIPEDSSP
jgi:hypothetical protein